MAELTPEDLARHNKRISDSNQLMDAARKVLKTFPRQTEILEKDPKASVPYIMTNPETAQGPITPAPPSPTRGNGPDLDTQARIQQILNRRLTKINSDTATSTLSIEQPTQPNDPQATTIKIPESDENKPKKEEKPYLKDPEVITEEIATSDVKYLSISTVTYPLPDEGGEPFIPRNIAEEGYWLPEIPLHKPSNVFRVENRLLWADPDRQHFFGADGHIKTDTPGVIEISPPFPVEPPNHDGIGMIEFRSAQADNVQEQSTTREMVIEVRNVKFLVHSLSSQEDIESARLEMAYNAYVNNLKADKPSYYKKRIMALLGQLNHIDKDDEKRKEILTKLIECYELNDQESAFSGSLRDEIIRTNHKLKDARKEANYVSTPCQLRWQKFAPKPEDVARDQAKLDDFIQKRAAKMVELEELCGRKADINQMIQEIKERRKALCLRQPGEPEWHPVFSKDMSITPNDQVPIDEQERRANIGKTQIMMRIVIQNQTELKTNFVKLSNSFESIFNKTIELKTTRLTPSITIEIGEQDFKKKTKTIAKLSVPVYVGEPPEYFNYEFTSDFQLENGNMIIGTVDARVYFKPETTQDILISIPDPADKTKKRLITDPSQFVSVPKIIEDAKKMDQNDPYKQANLAMLVSSRAKERVGKKFKLDSAVESITFNSFVPQSVNFQQQLKLQRLLDERARAKAKKKEGDDTYLSKIRENAIVQDAVVKKQVALTDIVGEAPLPTIPSFFAAIAARLFMFRPLKPLRKERVPSANIQTYSKIIIHIVRGMNIPQRTTVSTGPKVESTLIYSAAIGQETNVMARITFNNEIQRTYPVSGESPEWNQRFMFNVSKDKNEIPTISELEKKSVRIDLFDRLVLNVVEDDRQAQTTHSITEDRFMASIEFPVGAIWASGKIDGVITMNTSPFILGYNKSKEPIKLSVFFTIDPPMKIDQTVSERESAEKIEVKLRAESWMQKMKSNEYAKGRNIRLMATPTNGLPILVCRMITPQNLPDGYTRDDRVKIARFVSLFPNVSDNQVFGTINDVWCSSQQFINMKAGDDEEHAALLCNYFKFIGLDAYIVFGYSIDNGASVYVLTKEAGQFTLWDPLTGRFFNAKDRFCPLYSVGCIANETNVWANIQETGEPWTIDWNMSNSGYWHPFFASDFPLTSFDSPQETVLKYQATEVNTLSLERNIEVSVKSAVEKARDQQRTYWNREFSLILRKALEKCEKAVSQNSDEDFRGVLDEVAQAFPSHRMFGTPFVVPFKDVEYIVSEVKKQEIYQTENPRIEFGLGVYVVPYPNNLKAVWVMLGVLENIRPGGNRL